MAGGFAPVIASRGFSPATKGPTMDVSRILGLPDDSSHRNFGIDLRHNGDLDAPCETCGELLEFKKRIEAMRRMISAVGHATLALGRELNQLDERFGDRIDEFGHDAEITRMNRARGDLEALS